MLMAGTSSFATDSLADGDAIVTLRGGLPCFSFPVSVETEKRDFFLDRISVPRSSSIPGRIRDYHSVFCLGYDSAGEKAVVDAAFSTATGRYECGK